MEINDGYRVLWDQLVHLSAIGRMSLREFREYAEARYIEYMLDAARGNQCRAARDLGEHRNTLARQLEKFNIDPHGVSQGRSV